MAKMCAALMSAELNIHYAYSLYVRPHGLPVVVLHCDDQGLATNILIRKHFALLAENDLGDNATNSAPPEPGEN